LAGDFKNLNNMSDNAAIVIIPGPTTATGGVGSPGPTTATGGQPSMTNLVPPGPTTATGGPITTSTTAVTPDPGRENLSRSQIREFVRSLQVGTRIRLAWRYGPTTDEEATKTLTWTGEVLDLLFSADGIPFAHVRYDVGCEEFEEGGILPFPPPSDGTRMAELTLCQREKRKGSFPRFIALAPKPTITANPATPDPSANVEPPTKKTRLERGEDRLISTLEHLVGEGTVVLKEELTEGLRVPRSIDVDHIVFYPHRWLKGTEWLAAFERLKSRWQIQFTNSSFLDELNALADAHASLVDLAAAIRPQGKEQWFPLFWSSACIARLLAMARAKDKSWDAGEKLKSSFLVEWRKTDCTINWSKLFAKP
jgi:hypothetical protein